jgi:filamentous hemagglutinin family protein
MWWNINQEERNYFNQLHKQHNYQQKFRETSITKSIWLFTSFTGWYLINSNPLQAQITPDNTVNTQINTNNNITEITGGTQAESNLFHSFQDFSVATGETAFFNNNLDIQNIISRVTGENISNIDGLIKANGDANLILINPNGINFGGNASLDIGGSFLGSTADSVIFTDGTIFSAKDTQANPLLTINVPLGLQIGQSSGEINVSGEGHNLTVADPIFSPMIFGEQSGLRVQPGQTLALVGKGINLDGGTIAAPGGRVELASVAAGIVNLNFSDSNLSLSYEDSPVLDNIQLRSQALADATGTESIPGGSIQVQGKQLTLSDGSLLLVQNLAGQDAGEINVNASESVTISNTNNDGTIRSSLTNETLGRGKGGNIQVTTKQLTVDQGATIVTKTLSPGTATGGNISINAIDSVQVIGSNRINPSVTSSIIAASLGTGDGGNNTITTNVLNAEAGGTVAASTFNTGNGGNLQIAAKTIKLVGIEPIVFVPSTLTASTLGAGDAGNLTIDTTTLTVLGGGRVDASTGATGNAGSLTINATDFVRVSDTVPDSLNPSLIASSVNIVDPILQQFLGLPPIPSGNSGDVEINTSQLNVTNGAEVSVVNEGLGNAGKLQINANSILLDNQGSLSAATRSGVGGNITLSANNVFLRGNSTTTATAGGGRNGGNININANNLVALENSQITANANQGIGGNIQVNTKGTYYICAECQITASSRLGVDGVVNIETLEPNTELEILNVPQQPSQEQETVAVGCPAASQANSSELTITGRGGLPSSPQGTLNSESLINFDAPSSKIKQPSNSASNNISKLPLPARGWYRDEKGTIILSAQALETVVNNSIINAPKCNSIFYKNSSSP